MDEAIEKERLKIAEKEAWKARKKLQRLREKESKTLYQRVQNREQCWADNRAALSPSDLANLMRRQEDFLEIALVVEQIIDKLKPDCKIGPPDGLLFPDLFFLEVQEYVKKTNPDNRIIWHPSEAEFVELYDPAERKACPGLLELFHDADKDWFDFGAYTKFSDDVLDAFSRALIEYLDGYQDENFDPKIAQEIRASWQARHPRRELTNTIIMEADSLEDRRRKEEAWAEKGLSEQQMDALRTIRTNSIRYGI